MEYNLEDDFIKLRKYKNVPKEFIIYLYEGC
jgi:hypothetical protein